MTFSVIIPTYNEERFIHRLIRHLQYISAGLEVEIIVSDGGSTDKTVEMASRLGVHTILCPVKGRAGQMNYAANQAKGEILFFVHADCLPPSSCFKSILAQIKAGAEAGCFRYRFDSDRFLLRVNAYFNKFGGLICRGGDQTLFIKKTVFQSLNGFNEKFTIMEDYDLVRRIQKQHQFVVIPEYALVSARKYDENTWVKVNFVNTVAMLLFVTGTASPQRIKSTYHSLIKHPKDS